MMRAYSSSKAIEITKVSQRCLDYWDERGIVRPSMKRSRGKGFERRYSFHDLVKLSVVKHLRDAGLSLQRIQKSLKLLREITGTQDPLIDRRLITDGKSVHVLTDNPAALEDVLGGGQLVFSVIAVDQIQKVVKKRASRYKLVAI